MKEAFSFIFYIHHNTPTALAFANAVPQNKVRRQDYFHYISICPAVYHPKTQYAFSFGQSGASDIK